MLLSSAHDAYLYILFLLLVGSDDDRKELVKEILGTPTCLFDGFSRDFVQRFRDELAGPEAMAILEAVALMQGVSIAHIECRNAKLRRLQEAQHDLGSHGCPLPHGHSSCSGLGPSPRPRAAAHAAAVTQLEVVAES